LTQRTNHPRRRPSAAKRPPALVLRWDLEESPRLMIEAESFEDEQRLLLWVKRNRAARRLLADIGVAA